MMVGGRPIGSAYIAGGVYVINKDICTVVAVCKMSLLHTQDRANENKPSNERFGCAAVFESGVHQQTNGRFDDPVHADVENLLKNRPGDGSADATFRQQNFRESEAKLCPHVADLVAGNGNDGPDASTGVAYVVGQLSHVNAFVDRSGSALDNSAG